MKTAPAPAGDRTSSPGRTRGPPRWFTALFEGPPISDIMSSPVEVAGCGHTPGWHAPRVPEPDETTPAVAVVDLDGVVADVRHRLHHVQSRPRDWDAFFAAIPDDPPLDEGRRLVLALAADHELVYLTGRPERTRPATEAWLAAHGLPLATLLMRADGDHRPARLAKPAVLARRLGRRRVAMIVDDDPEVCAALEAAGWPVRLADWMPRPDALDAAQERIGRT